MLRRTVRSLWDEPRAPDPPVFVWRDWVLIGALLPTAVLEGLLREQVVWRPVALVIAVGAAVALLWRRTDPLLAVVVVFGSLIVIDVAALVAGVGPVGINTTVLVVLFPYSLFRWGSGREATIGMAVILVAMGLGITLDYTGIVEAVFGSLFLLFPATLGATVRYWTAGRARELDQAKMREREQLARELHDTVAHQVSAIAIRAQAGRVLAATEPEAALDALAVIEDEASLTLAEMRVMVRGLRDADAPALAPQPGVADLASLARRLGELPHVEVDLSGELDDLGPAVGGADPPGYGVVGMTERAVLLGGSCAAGPGRDGGWVVTATLPKAGATR